MLQSILKYCDNYCILKILSHFALSMSTFDSMWLVLNERSILFCADSRHTTNYN